MPTKLLLASVLAVPTGWARDMPPSAPFSPVQYSAQAPTEGTPLPALPAPDLAEDATPMDYLNAAKAAVIQGEMGMAREALEMAQTRMLDRSVPLFQTHDASNHPAVRQINDALQALSEGDRVATLRKIDEVARILGAPAQ